MAGVLVLCACLLSACEERAISRESPPFDPTPGFEVARLVRVVDGDTIVVSLGGEEERLRYIGIDSPEFEDDRELAERSAEANERLLGEGWMQLERDVSERDRFGRLLRYVWVDGRMVNEELVHEGFAVAATFPPDVKHVERLREAERSAREAGVGLWAEEAFR